MMTKSILINDGISELGKRQLIDCGFNVIDKHIEQKDLIEFINKNKIIAILIRSTTKIKKEIIDACPSIKLIGRGGVGMDNIDVEYAKKRGLYVINTPSASSLSVAELVFTHLFSLVRFTYHSNRTMQLEGAFNFKKLKKNYSNGIELKGKILGIIGFGKIGQEVAKIGIGIGMKILFYDPYIDKQQIRLNFYNNSFANFELSKTGLSELLKNSDFITVHVPKQKNPIIRKTKR